MISKEGFDFVFDPNACSDCGGKCCYGESGYIFVNFEDFERISKYLNMSFHDFVLTYVRKVKYKFSLIEKKCIDSSKGMACIFFDEDTNKCKIYEVRPSQCRTFPFWNTYKSSSVSSDCGSCNEQKKKSDDNDMATQNTIKSISQSKDSARTRKHSSIYLQTRCEGIIIKATK